MNGEPVVTPPRTARMGVSAASLVFEGWGWLFREQPIEDYGIDAHVELVVPLYQEDVAATRVAYHPRYSPPLETIRRTVREARARGLAVLLFPIVRLVTTHGPNEWRGTLRPSIAARGSRATGIVSKSSRSWPRAKLAKTGD